MRQTWGQWPLLVGGQNLGLPFMGIAPLIAQALTLLESRKPAQGILLFSEIWVIFVLVVNAGTKLRTTSLPRPIMVVWALYALIGACLSYVVLSTDVNFERGLSELIVLCFLFLLAQSMAPLRWAILCFQLAFVVLHVYTLSI